MLAWCVLLAGCQDTDPLYCGKHPADLARCPRDGCFAVEGLDLVACDTTKSTAPIAITAATTVDTTTGTSMPAGFECAPLDATSASACLLDGASISIAAGAKLIATGNRPLVLAATGAIDIAGAIDVASHTGASGAGSISQACTGVKLPTGQGGGAGGSFGGEGGDGGNQFGVASSGGVAAPALSPTTLRGGCPGSAGAAATADGNGGGAGGAVALIGASISIEGEIDASGEGGGAGHAGGGGGGGGAGGMIVVSAPALTLGTMASLYANGGHGGGGATMTMDGAAGTDPDGPTSGGNGGTGAQNSMGGNGGVGFPSTARGGADSTNAMAGGGGGGGAAGVVQVYGAKPPSAAGISPPAS
ncbi:MAG TPA: hypothetical protein VMJ10_32190 [Kofleriaceae bacterium]|nr:hypothetical protein [Kofleriaceae bacterium]